MLWYLNGDIISPIYIHFLPPVEYITIVTLDQKVMQQRLLLPLELGHRVTSAYIEPTAITHNNYSLKSFLMPKRCSILWHRGAKAPQTTNTVTASGQSNKPILPNQTGGRHCKNDYLSAKCVWLSLTHSISWLSIDANKWDRNQALSIANELLDRQ